MERISKEGGVWVGVLLDSLITPGLRGKAPGGGVGWYLNRLVNLPKGRDG